MMLDEILPSRPQKIKQLRVNNRHLQPATVNCITHRVHQTAYSWTVIMEDTVTVNVRDIKPPQRRLETVDVNLFNVEDRPPFVFSFLNAIQIVICQVINLMWLPLALSPSLCLLPADPTRVHLTSSAFLVSGVVSSFQSTLGLRLPSIAAPSVLYIARFLSLLHSPEWECPSSGDLFAMGPDLRAEEWQARLRELQGVLLLAGVLQVILGFSGIQASLCRVLSPVVVAPSIILTGLSVIHKPLNMHLDIDWTLFIIVTVSIIVFSFCLREISLPLPTFSLQSGLTARSFPLFRMFPVLWAYVAVYLIYKVGSIFVSTTPFPNTEVIAYQEAVDNSKWFFFSFPFAWGFPTLSTATAVHMFPAILLQTVTSMVMFHGNAQSCGMAFPTQASVRRGLGFEGLGLMFGSCWAHGVSTNTANVGLNSLSGIVSRSSTQLAALMMVCVSHFTELSAWLVNIPVQLLTALYLSLHIGLVSVGCSVLKFINFSSQRDCFVVGLSLFIGLTVPQYVSQENSAISQYLLSSVALGTSCAILLDLILPGRGENTGSQAWRCLSEEDMKTYRLPTWEELLCSALENTPFFSTT